MFIEWRTSGGRGEYELDGQLAGRHATDFTGWDFELDVPVLGVRPTGVYLSNQGGKPRLRRRESSAVQIARQLAAYCLLPDPVRDMDALSNGLPVILAKRYAIRRVDVTQLTSPAPQVARLKLGTVELTSGSGNDDQFPFATRMQRVKRIWERSAVMSALVATALTEHEAQSSTSPGTNVHLRAVESVMSALETVDPLYVAGTDPLPALEALAGLNPVVAALDPTDVPAADPDLRRRVATLMRLQKTRDAASARFRKKVTEAYDFQCAFCGIRLPRGEHVRRSGVDACHILGWSTFDLDDVINGLCLCKLHHWAFDEQILVLEVDQGNYAVRLSKRAEKAFAADPTTLAQLESVVGPIPASRLPPKQSERPSAAYIARWYSDVSPD